MGYSFVTEHAGVPQKVEVKEKQEVQYIVEYADGNEDHLTHEELINMLTRETGRGRISPLDVQGDFRSSSCQTEW